MEIKAWVLFYESKKEPPIIIDFKNPKLLLKNKISKLVIEGIGVLLVNEVRTYPSENFPDKMYYEFRCELVGGGG
jgi:hypothetical protein